MKKAILADLHTHTLASQHAYSTLRENIVCAQQHNIDYIAVTDHLFYLEDRIDRLNEIARVTNTKQLTRISTMRVIGGVETNLNHTIAWKDVEMFENFVPWRLVGLHSWFLNTDPSVLAPEEIPSQFEASLTGKSRIKPTAFAHIERGLEKICKAYGSDQVCRALQDVVDLAVKYDVYLEINNSSIGKSALARDLMHCWITYAKEKRARFCLGTDAHYCDLVGDFRDTKELLDELDLWNSYILNCDPQALEALFQTNGGVKPNAKPTDIFTA